MRYHLANSGPRLCRAKTEASCPLSGEHFDDKASAYTAFEMLMQGSFTLGGDEKSAAMSLRYAQYSILSDHLHNSSRVGSPEELYYYSSPAGQLELKRRIMQTSKKDYKVIAQRLKSGEAVNQPEIDEEQLKQWAVDGEALVRSESLGVSDNVPWETKQKIAAFLTEQSHEWLKKASTEEQEAISFLTSNGFYLLQDSVNDELTAEARMTATPFLKNKIQAIEKSAVADYEEMQAKTQRVFKGFSKAYRAKVLAALGKAPQLSEPLKAYRGTSMAAIEAELGTTDVKAKLKSGDLIDASFGPESTYGKIPRSASLISSRALSFCTDEESVILELKQHTMASPVMVSAWGGSEAEVYTNPTSVYSIKGYREEKDAGGWDVLIIEVEETPSGG